MDPNGNYFDYWFRRMDDQLGRINSRVDKQLDRVPHGNDDLTITQMLFMWDHNDAQFDEAGEKLDSVETNLEGRFHQVEGKIDDVETGLGARFDEVGNRLDDLETKVDDVETVVDNRLDQMEERLGENIDGLREGMEGRFSEDMGGLRKNAEGRFREDMDGLRKNMEGRFRELQKRMEQQLSNMDALSRNRLCAKGWQQVLPVREGRSRRRQS